MKTNLKPFDLKAALKGEPVMLRNGSKAFVRHHETEVVDVEGWQLWGVVIGKGNSSFMVTWTKSVGHNMDGDESGLDIIGMWPKTRIINGFEVPAPETGEPECGYYYLASTINEYFYRQINWEGDRNDKFWLKRGLVFLNKEDAIANAEAMVGIDPYKESEE